MTYRASVVAVSLACLAAPAAAEQQEPQPRHTPAITVNADGGTTTARKTRYCLSVVPPVSRIRRLHCRTREQWMAQENFDPIAPKR